METRTKIGISGANSNLGSLLRIELKKSGFEIIEFSSNPKNGQSQFEIEGIVDYREISNCKFLIHCARPYETYHEKTLKEIEILKEISNCEVKILNISSVSGFLDEKSAYGIHKRAIHDWIEINSHINILTGLIFGKEFHGQIAQLLKALTVFPVKPAFEGEFHIFLSPVQELTSAIRSVLEYETICSKSVIGKNPILTNTLLSDLSNKRALNLNLNRDLIYWILKMSPKNKYFNADSFLGFTGKYGELSNLEINRLEDGIIHKYWQTYCKNGGK